MLFDRKGNRLRLHKARRAESAYSRALAAVARQVKAIVQAYTAEPDTAPKTEELAQVLEQYAQILAPWAGAVARYMTATVAAQNAKAWKQHSARMGVAMRQELTTAPTGALLQQLLDENVHLITSLPTEAAKQVHAMAKEVRINGQRASSLIPRIQALGGLTEARARLIARTEVARCANGLTAVRARHIGSEGYIWRTAGDDDVRDSHAEMEGTYVRWDTVPKLSDGTQTHAGMIYNCRCFPEPVLPELDD
jgi:SPP1 gp7 family putative phage head morphogenesis protein